MRALAIFLSALLAGPALAEPWGCSFTVECVAAEDCGESGYSFDILAADHEGRLFLSSIASDTPVVRLSRSDGGPAVYVTEGDARLVELITINPDGTAVMTAHAFDERTTAVTYFGTCEEL